MSFIDTHFHLDKYRNHQDLYTLINEKKQYTLCVTCSPGVFLSCKKMYPETKYIKFGLGIHPEEIRNPEKEIYEFNACIDQAHYIGEIGLDYSNTKARKEEQLKVLRHILKIQARRNLLATIHVKKAEDDLIGVLNEFPSAKRIIHWFTGTEQQMLNMLNAGCYFSINASMIQSENGKKNIMQIPKDRLLVESDGPYSKINGKRFSPDKLEESYRVIESALHINDLEGMVYENFFALLSK